MKRLILSGLILLFLATTFRSDSSGGWVQQTLPRADVTIQDIFFMDSLNGWSIGMRNPVQDTGFVFRTTNGGTNWNTVWQQKAFYFATQFLDLSTGYIAGSTGTGSGRLYKTTDGGTNWNLMLTAGTEFADLFFINKDTGWVCDDDVIFGAGLLKTTNGGINWSQQLNNTYKPLKLFFINKDTGWVGTNEANGRLFKTINGGTNWNLQYTTAISIGSIFFINSLHGWIESATGNGSAYTTDGGLTWTNGQGNVAAYYDVKFITDSIGFSGGSLQRVGKSTDGGKNWGYQSIPIFTAIQTFFFKGDSLHGWMGTNGIIKTTDGGGPITYVGISPSSTLVPSFKLLQNYPNPFNPSTSIDFDVKKNSRISLRVFSVDGREVDELLDYEKFTTGSYYVKYEASNRLASGVYFYQMTGWTDDGKEIFIDTKKMLMIK